MQKHITLLVIFSIIIVLITSISAVSAPNKYWIGGTGYWDVASNWDPWGEPYSSSRVAINSGRSKITEWWGTCEDLSVGYTSIGKLDIISGSLSVDSADVGFLSRGTVLQQGGSVNVQWGLHVGVGINSVGTYTLENGSLHASSTYIASYGTGTFNQSGGTHTRGPQFPLTIKLAGDAGNGNGTYNFSGGSIEALGIYIGDTGTGTFNHIGGISNVDCLVLGRNTDSTGTYSISGGDLCVGALLVGTIQGTGVFNINNSTADIEVSHRLKFGALGSFSAVPDSIIYMRSADFENESTDPVALGGVSNLTLIFEYGSDTIEVGGRDYGASMEGFGTNFDLDTLTVRSSEQLQLVDLFDNQPSWEGTEALYVNNLMLGSGSLLDLNGLNLYYINESIDPTATIIENGGTLTQILVFPGDFEPDGDVDFVDFATFAFAWLTEPGDAQWNPNCDISIPADNYIDWLDLVVLTDNWLAGL